MKQAIVLLLAICGCITPSFAENTSAVKVTFSDFLNKQLPRINAIEQERERIFREFRMEGTRTAIPSNASNNRSRFGATEWGNERLVPELSEYSVENLFHALFEKGLQRVAPEFDGFLEVKITKLRVEDFSLASISQPNTQIKGEVIMRNADGQLIAEKTIWTTLLTGFSAARVYTGPDYAYREGALNTRIAPIAVEFSEKVLESLFPDSDAPGVVIVEL